MAILVPKIESVIEGLITVTVLSPSVVEQTFDQLLLYRSSSANGPFSQIASINLSGQSSYTFLDTGCDPSFYYKAQFFNSSSMVMSQFSNLAQETGTFSPFSLPTSTATYPPEIALTEQDREIVESIRVTLGDMGNIERDFFDSSDPQSAFVCDTQISADGCTWELSEPKGWPQKVVLNGESKTRFNDPQVLGYRYLVFSGSQPCITGSLDVFYNHFRFSDREIILAFDRASNLLTATCNLTSAQITFEMKIMQAAILLLEGELRDIQTGGAIRIRDGDTEFDNTDTISARTQDLEDLKRKLRELIECVRWEVSYRLEGVRLD